MVNNSQHPQICAMLSALLFVDYQWCHVLFKNNTVSKMITMIMALRVIMIIVMTIMMIVRTIVAGIIFYAQENPACIKVDSRDSILLVAVAR